MNTKQCYELRFAQSHEYCRQKPVYIAGCWGFLVFLSCGLLETFDIIYAQVEC